LCRICWFFLKNYLKKNWLLEHPKNISVLSVWKEFFNWENLPPKKRKKKRRKTIPHPKSKQRALWSSKGHSLWIGPLLRYLKEKQALQWAFKVLMYRVRTCVGGSLNFYRTAGSGSLNVSESKNCQFQFFEKNSESKNRRFQFFNVLNNVRTLVIYQIQWFEHFETLLACKWVYTCVDNRKVPVPHSKNCPTVKYHKNIIQHPWMKMRMKSFMKITKIFILAMAIIPP